MDDLFSAIDFHLVSTHSCMWENWLGPDGRLLWLSDHVESVTGRKPAECLATPGFPASIFIEADRPIYEEILAKAQAGEAGTDRPLRIRRADGVQAWVYLSWRGVFGPQGELVGVRLAVRDAAEAEVGGGHRRYREALSQLVRSGVVTGESFADALAALVSTASQTLDIERVGVWLFGDDRQDLRCRVLVERGAVRFDGLDRIRRSSYPRYFAALDQDRVIAAEAARADPRTAELTADYLDPLGIAAILDAPVLRGGVTVGVLCHEQRDGPRHWSPDEIDFASSLADLTAMALEAAERRDGEALHRRLASVLEATPDFVGTLDADGRPTYLNPAGRALLGMADDGPGHWDLTRLYTPWALERVSPAALAAVLKDGLWHGESEFLTQDGTAVPVAQVLIAHQNSQGVLQYLSTIARDLRPWRTAQAALQERERFLTTLVANLPGMAYRRRNAPGWPMEYVSPGCLDLTGYPPEVFLSGTLNYTAVVHADDRTRVYAEVDAALAERRAFEVEYRLCRADGSYRWVWSKGRGIYDDAGLLLAREGFICDIDERVTAQLELQRLNAELEARVAERTAKLIEANQHLEAFAYSVSHDLKAPLRGIDGYSRLLAEDYGALLPDDGRRFLENIRTAAARMNQLIDDLLTYSRLERRELSCARVGLASLVQRVLSERELEIVERGAAIVSEVGDLAVTADIDALLQALRNLVDNALKFSRDVPEPRIRIDAQVRERTIVVSVADNGCGFDMKYRDRIFDIFQRLHRLEDFPGTGVGLAIVRKALQRMGGQVWAESTPGAGACFFMELPV